MKFIVVTIIDGEIDFVSQYKTRRGAEISKKRSLRPWAEHEVSVRILSLEDILKWDDSGVSELEAMMLL